ncbi:hypothetical protein SPS_2 [Sphingomonas phage Scott]|uniref:Uncharacterized protein n=1 Tax=Sphingomonas phage Scott TaxID=2282912 RepID=A0A346FD99_9CAUD|nr:hypothetical protein HOT83_gp02 [Sphingomonas phage Scott]AXN53713.1 hypothetical protein SPS_2 [Sphingomonas phage Scott]
MIVAVWVLASLLVGALLAAFVLYGQTRKLDHKLFMADRTIANLRGDRDYWVRQEDNYRRRYTIAIDGLTAVQNLATGKMANIGNRMYGAATKARNAALSEPFDKS